MRRIEKVIQYFVLFFCMMILLLVLNVVFIGVVEVQTSDEQSYPKAEKMAEYLKWDENGKCAMAKEGTDIVDLYQGFAMVIDNTGKIIWEYKLPEELEQTYTLQEAVQKAQVIEEQAIRIRSLITNLNTENKLAYGMGNWEKEKILLPALIREISCDWLNRNIGEQYELNVDISQKLEQFYVTGNRELLRRMLDNLINNAIVHNPEGCKIMISLQEKKVGWRTKCELTVSDNGQGASKELLRKLQAPLKLERLSEHGLGLRLVKRIAKMQHWRVRFCNHAEGGFCCRIEM